MYKNPKLTFLILLLILILNGLNNSPAYSKSQKNTNFNKSGVNLFSTDEMINICIETDIDYLLNNRCENCTYQNAKLFYLDKHDCSKISLNIKVKPRGHFRLNPKYCEFPPLKIKFLDTNIKDTLFKNQTTLKLVTHCNGENYILQEYLIYKQYNIFTDFSFKVRLAEITYIDTKGNYEPFTNYGFFIEKTKHMASRNNAVNVSVDKVDKDLLNYNYTTLIYLFEYMIGNNDWDIDLGKNFKFLYSDDSKSYIPVPYDFDLAHIINPDYPNLSDIYGNEKIEKPKFRKLRRNKNELTAVFNIFKYNKNNIFDLYSRFPYLNYYKEKEIIDYYKQFCKEIRRKRLIKKIFIYSDKKK
ncbi:MAG: hypothetical protein DRJ01_03140 [Bacteroidetes bacterium]|nr:MAG: hypothetical protein DRJ01_03140 [Bacteroidota bacterium]